MRQISLLLADIDGTLVTEQKVLTERAKRAVDALREEEVRFAITSGRPPRGTPQIGHNPTIWTSPPAAQTRARSSSPCPGISDMQIATIGDMPNDVLMFRRSGFSIAMGNASAEALAQASAVTDSYNDEGFAKAVEKYLLDGQRPS